MSFRISRSRSAYVNFKGMITYDYVAILRSQFVVRSP